MAGAIGVRVPLAQLRNYRGVPTSSIRGESRERCASQALRRGPTLRSSPSLVLKSEDRVAARGRGLRQNGAVGERRRRPGVPRVTARAPARVQDDAILDDLAEVVLDVAEQVAQEVRRNLILSAA